MGGRRIYLANSATSLDSNCWGDWPLGGTSGTKEQVEKMKAQEVVTIHDAALEKAAKLVEGFAPANAPVAEVAAAIRALKQKKE